MILWSFRGQRYYPANIYLFKVSKTNTRKSCDICSNLTIKSQERYRWNRSVFIVNFGHISHLFQSASGGNKCLCCSSHALCNGRVRSCVTIILLPPMMGTSFVLAALTSLIVSEPKHRVTWSHRTCVNFPFLREERIQYFSVSA